MGKVFSRLLGGGASRQANRSCDGDAQKGDHQQLIDVGQPCAEDSPIVGATETGYNQSPNQVTKSQTVTYDVPWERKVAFCPSAGIMIPQRDQDGVAKQVDAVQNYQVESGLYDVPWENSVPKSLSEVMGDRGFGNVKTKDGRTLNSLNKQLEQYGVAFIPAKYGSFCPGSPPRSRELRLVVTRDSPLKSRSAAVMDDDDTAESISGDHSGFDDQELFEMSMDEELEPIDEGNDDGFKEQLDNQAWFHMNVDRRQAEMLINDQPDGSFLVRSMADGADSVLSVKSGGNVVHMKIQKDDVGKWVVGAHSRPFDSICELIQYYSKEKLPIFNVQHVRLSNPIFRSLY